MTTALLVEGTTDKRTIRALVTRLAEGTNPRMSLDFRVKTRSKLLDGDYVANVVQFDLINVVSRLDRVIVCADMECDPAEDLAAARQRAVERVQGRQLGIRVDYHLVRFALESWLIADPGAWQRRFRLGPAFCFPSGLSEACDPRRTVTRFLKARHVDYRPTLHNAEIASEMDLTVARANCPNLSEFLSLVESLN